MTPLHPDDRAMIEEILEHTLTPTDLQPVATPADLSARQLLIARILWARSSIYYFSFMRAITALTSSAIERLVLDFPSLQGARVVATKLDPEYRQHIEILIDRRLNRDELAVVSSVSDLSAAQLGIVSRLVAGHRWLCLTYLRAVLVSSDEERVRVIDRMHS